MRFECPACKAIRSVNKRLLGRKIRCPDCGGFVQLPSADEAERLQRQREKRESESRTVQASALRPTIVEAVKPRVPMAKGSQEDPLTAEEKVVAEATLTFTRPRPSAREDMDMTPMVDVTFLLLIFFMITASFSVQKTIQRPAERKDAPSINAVQTPEDDNPEIVTVQVDEFNAYNVITADWDRVAGNKQDLIVALSDAHAGDAAGNQPSRLVVQAHEDCIHGAVVDALDAGREAMFESFEVSTVEQFD